MDAHREMIWQRGPKQEVLREEHRRFRASMKTDLVSAHVSLASVYATLAGQYSGWRRVYAVWYAWRAVHNAKDADRITCHKPGGLKADQADVVSAILAKAPWWVGGNSRQAVDIAQYSLYVHPDRHQMKPHTRALLEITIGRVYEKRKEISFAEVHFGRACDLFAEIEGEDSDDRDCQLVRVASSVAFFYLNHRLGDRYWANKLLTRSLELADRVSRDQAEKIRAEMRKRGL